MSKAFVLSGHGPWTRVLEDWLTSEKLPSAFWEQSPALQGVWPRWSLPSPVMAPSVCCCPSPPPHCPLAPHNDITSHHPGSCSQATDLFLHTESFKEIYLDSAFSPEKSRCPTSETNTDYGVGRRPFPQT